jgi:magnesium-transporting ATPase (P-type)
MKVINKLKNFIKNNERKIGWILITPALIILVSMGLIFLTWYFWSALREILSWTNKEFIIYVSLIVFGILTFIGFFILLPDFESPKEKEVKE